MTPTTPRRFRLLLAAALVLLALEPAAPAPASLDAANLSPVVQIYGLPRLTQAPQPAAGTRLRLDLDWASHATSDGLGRPFVRFDGETRRYTLTATGPLAPDDGSWWALEIPWLAHTGGVLDGVVEGWHDALGLPNGDRDGRPRDELLFWVIDDSGREVLRRTGPARGVGDVALAAGLPLPGGAIDSEAGIRIEAPTGDPDRLLGSGGWDVASWLAAQGRPGGGAWSWHVAGGLLYMSSSDILPAWHRRWAGFGRAALRLAWSQTLSLAAQVDGHTPLYDSPLDPLGQGGLELRLGAAWEPANGYRVEAGFSEDVAVGTAPDITFHLHLSRSAAASQP